MKDSQGLMKKLSDIGHKIRRMAPDGYNEHSRYKFISHNQVTEKLSELLHEAGILFMPSVISSEEQTFQAKEKQGVRTKVSMKFTFRDLESEDFLTFTWEDADQDTGGKSFAQAVTQCQKRFFLKFFLIAEGEPDPDSKTVEAPGYSWAEIMSEIAKHPELPALLKGKTKAQITRIWEECQGEIETIKEVLR